MKGVIQVLVICLLLVQLALIPATGAAGFRPPQCTVSTQAVTNVQPLSATFNASVQWSALTGGATTGNIKPVSTTGNYATNYNYSQPAATGYFRYGTSSAALTSSTPQVSVPWGSPTFGSDVVGLFPCKTYYVQAMFIYQIEPIDYDQQPADYLIALFSANGENNMSGLGVGLNRLFTVVQSQIPIETQTTYGNIVSFTTPGCVTNIGSHNASSPGYSYPTMNLASISVQTAALSTTSVTPGEKVDVTATVTNQGTGNGDTKITLYVNGHEVESKGLTIASGQSEPVHFTISRNEPGTYSVQVGGVSAGSFTVDAFNNSMLIYGIIGLFTIAIAAILYLLARKRTA